MGPRPVVWRAFGLGVAVLFSCVPGPGIFGQTDVGVYFDASLDYPGSAGRYFFFGLAFHLFPCGVSCTLPAPPHVTWVDYAKTPWKQGPVPRLLDLALSCSSVSVSFGATSPRFSRASLPPFPNVQANGRQQDHSCDAAEDSAETDGEVRAQPGQQQDFI